MTSNLCPHFSTCGGCAFQDVPWDVYDVRKIKRVTDAFAKEGIAFPEPLYHRCEPKSRRRVCFKMRRQGDKTEYGFYGRKSHDFSPIQECLVIMPSLRDAAEKLCEILTPSLVDGLVYDLWLVEVDQGIDGMIVGEGPLKIPSSIGPLARLRWGPHTWGQENLSLSFGRGSVPWFHAQGFCQATKEGERILQKWVTQDCPHKRLKIADLFAGHGTLTLPLSGFGHVDAFEMDDYGYMALKQAKCQKKITAHQRQLFSRPLTVLDLSHYDMVVMDPPRSGAQNQSEILGKSKVPLVVMVSCHPDTLSRDSRYLAQGGYECTFLGILDQFLWTSHVECVAIWKK